MAKQDSKHHTGRTGTGLTGMKQHTRSAKGYCYTCRSYTCYKTAFIPPQNKIWTWEERRRLFLAEVS